MYCAWPDFTRCCVCLPLRRGILVFAYFNLLATIGTISLEVVISTDHLIINRSESLPVELTIALCVLELIFTLLLIYGSHTKQTKYIRIYYYFAISSLLTLCVMDIIDLSLAPSFYALPNILCYITNLCLQLYLITLVRSLLKKLEVSEGHSFGNQLHQIVNGEIKTDDATNTVVPIETV